MHVFSKFSRIFGSFCQFFEVFGHARTCSDPFGPVWMHSDAFGCVQMRLDAFRHFWNILKFFAKILSKTTFFAISARFRRSWRQTDLKISFCVEFCSRYTYPEVCATQNRKRNILIQLNLISIDFVFSGVWIANLFRVRGSG